MINRIKALLGTASRAADPTPISRAAPDKHLAVAALLVEAAHMDARFDAREREAILALVAQRFALDGSEAESLLAEAQAAQLHATDLVRFTRTIKHAFTPAERVELVEMLWEVVYADGHVDPFEANLLRRVGGLIYVSDRDRGAARKRVAARLGVTEGQA